MKSVQQLRGNVNARFDRKADRNNYLSAIIGHPDGTVYVEGRPGYVWARVGGINGQIIQVYGRGMLAAYNLPIMIYRLPHRPRDYGIADLDLNAFASDGSGESNDGGYSGDGYVQNHAEQHWYTGGDPVLVHLRAWTPLRVYPSSGFTIGVMNGVIPRTGSDLEISTQTLDLTSHVPASGAVYCLITVNAAGVLTATDGTTVDSVLTLSLADIPDTPEGHFRLAAIRLYDSQTAITESRTVTDVVDLRWPQEKLASLITAAELDIDHLKIVATAGGDYTDVQSAITALSATGGIVWIMPGSYTSSTINLVDGVYLWSSGNASLQSNSGAVLHIPATGFIKVSGLQLSALGGGEAISCAAGSTCAVSLVDGRIVHVSGSYGIDLSGAAATAQLNLERFDIDFSSGGLATKAITHLTNCYLAGDLIQSASAGALTIETSHIVGALTITSTADLIGLPRIDGTVTGAPRGQYINSAYRFVSPLGTELIGGYTFTVGGNSTINGSLVGNISGGGTLATTTGQTYTFPTAGGTVPLGTGAANRVTFWSGTNTVSSDSNLTWTTGAGVTGLNVLGGKMLTVRGDTGDRSRFNTYIAGGSVSIDAYDDVAGAYIPITYNYGEYIRLNSNVGYGYTRFDVTNNRIVVFNATGVGVFTTFPQAPIHALTNGDTAGVKSALILDAARSSGGASGDGASISLTGKSSTTAAQSMALIEWSWATATHASRKARITGKLYDTAARTWIQVDTDGAASDVLINSLIYGSMYMDDGTQAVTATLANTYYEVGGGMTGSLTNGMTFQNSKELLVSVSGTYQVDWSISLSNNNSDQTIAAAVMVNSTEKHSTENATRAKENGVTYSLGGTGIIALAVNDVVKLCVENETAAGSTITVDHANLSIVRIGE